MNNIQKEIWKQVINENYPNCYFISNLGRIKKVINGKEIFLKVVTHGSPYLKVTLMDLDSKRHYFDAGLLVATYFVENPYGKRFVRYKDNDNTNISSENILWTDIDDPYWDDIENLDGEIWKKIPDFEEYCISNLGRVKSLPKVIQLKSGGIANINKAIILKPVISGDFYYVVNLVKNKSTYTKRIHRLVAESFVENPNNYQIVDHIDRNRLNNVYTNLRWVTPLENVYNGNSDSVVANFPDGTSTLFNSVKEACAATGVSCNCISRRCSTNQGKKSKDGITFTWANEHTKHSKLASKNRNKGNSLERAVVNDLKALGFVGCVTSRSESKNKDNNKIDIIDTHNDLPTNIQIKYLQNCPNYFTISSECSDKSKPFSIIWKKSTKDGSNSPGTIAMIPYNYFLHLLKIELEYKKLTRENE